MTSLTLSAPRTAGGTETPTSIFMAPEDELGPLLVGLRRVPSGRHSEPFMRYTKNYDALTVTAILLILADERKPPPSKLTRFRKSLARWVGRKLWRLFV